mmetsp:Transcript_48215/g.55702  ORF Transcript_48215/g.55702 Transcript_48215/m.55702 type:complete len:104 (+) Transcript_48215:38-349(+)|eukprot:CAMPEP_0176456388 /NCGR_PEP_ID=MMETSP0127-20121128/31254_1 /TAXON_ID=938130 /ORGANISM="Platyophrya macrostoma, Strain WH" /LENGTH=103 /DNA_ID=CAMNT_0017846329 /DNA_START=36 /DNA_END=347 /DNA_ORIENTATION=-
MSKGFDLSELEGVQTFEEEDAEYAGEDITLNFDLPDSKKLTIKFKGGQDVGWAKNCVCKELGCGQDDISLYFNGNEMPDILSLSDIAGLKDQSIVKVTFNKKI